MSRQTIEMQIYLITGLFLEKLESLGVLDAVSGQNSAR